MSNKEDYLNYTCLVNWSAQAIRITSQVAGQSSVNGTVIPLVARQAVMASRIANKTLAARNIGGSPTAFSGYIQWKKVKQCM